MTPRLSLGSVLALVLALPSIAPAGPVRIGWRDATPVRPTLAAAGLDESTFDAYVARTAAENVRRVREGDLDHLVAFLLQSTRITAAPAIEPALSARQLVEALPAARREAFLRGEASAAPPVPAEITARIAALLRAVRRPGGDARLAYFAALVETAFPDERQRAAGVAAAYLRAMRFLYEKEFVAQRDAAPAAAVAELYRRRGLSTDTAIEAGFVVHLGLGLLTGDAPPRRIRRVLIVGPGLDLAPRTALHEATPPASYQPWTVMDALLGLGLARAAELEIVAADINPRVVAHLGATAARPPSLRAASGLRAEPGLSLSRDYQEYVDGVGKALAAAAPALPRLRAEPLDIVTERLDGNERFDLIVATNILPYFDDAQLALALTNIGAMLAPGGVFLHNEQRLVLGEITAALGLPLRHSRHAVIATVAGAKAPLYDSVFLHVRPATAP
jgi:hypothetical protein